MKIAIDPGHGNSNRSEGRYDPGAVAAGVEEADVALQWALTGKWILEREFGLSVWLTRDDDSDPAPVGQRDDRAEAAGCSHFVSLHCNAADTSAATGTETFWRDAADKPFAQAVQDAAVAAMGRADRGLKKESQSQHSRLAVLDFGGPSCLLEIGFVTNAIDRARMLERERRVSFWRAVGRHLTGGS